jgi:hypothetical protein
MSGCPRVPLTLGVTGHRNLVAAELPAIKMRLRELFSDLERRFPQTPLRLLSPLAEGADQVAASIAREMGIDVLVPLPFSVEKYTEDFDTTAAADAFLALAEGNEQVQIHDLDGSELLADSGDGERANAYARVGAYVSDHCEILIALWDGKPSGHIGGTAQVVDYHQFGEMAGMRATEPGLRMVAEDDTDLVFHIACSRATADGAPAEGLSPGSARWLVADPDRVEVPDIPASLALMIRRAGELNEDVSRLASSVRPTADVLGGWEDGMEDHPEVARTGCFFAAADHLANYYRRRHRAILRTLYLFAVLMGASFIAYADLNSDGMIIAFLALFFVGFGLYQWANSKQWHRRFLDYRALAEGLRVQFYWRLAGVSGSLRTDFAYDNFLHKQDVEIGWIRNVMRFAGTPEGIYRPPDDHLDRVIDLWIGKPRGTGQLGYFQARYQSHRKHVAATSTLVASCMWAGIAITITLALFQRGLPATVVNVLVAGMGLLPLIAAVREAYAHKVAEKELLNQYSFMLRLYREARFRLSRCSTPDQKRQILRALGEAALDEHAEWILVHRGRPLEPGKL